MKTILPFLLSAFSFSALAQLSAYGPAIAKAKVQHAPVASTSFYATNVHGSAAFLYWTTQDIPVGGTTITNWTDYVQGLVAVTNHLNAGGPVDFTNSADGINFCWAGASRLTFTAQTILSNYTFWLVYKPHRNGSYDALTGNNIVESGFYRDGGRITYYFSSDHYTSAATPNDELQDFAICNGVCYTNGVAALTIATPAVSQLFNYFGAFNSSSEIFQGTMAAVYFLTNYALTANEIDWLHTNRVAGKW